MDGSTPTLDSNVYSLPIPIKDLESKKDDLSYIRTTPNLDKIKTWMWKEPKGNIKKATVIKAMEVRKTGEKSDILTETYWIDEKGKERYTMPVISISTNPEKLFGYEEGIYVPGKKFDENTIWEDPWGPGNYREKLRIDANIEFYENDGTKVYSREAPIRIKGSTSAVLPQKSIKIHKPIKYPIFPDLKDINGKLIDEQGRIVLRNSGQGFLFTHFADALMQELVKETNVATQAYRPAIVFINGEYWGIQEIREEYDRRYISNHYDVSDKKVDFLKSSYDNEYGLKIEEGSINHYISMLNYMRNNDVSNPQVYERLSTMMDMDNYTSYNAMEIYFQNTDWPLNNICLWRYQAKDYDENASYERDGRWRWMLYDTDYGFGVHQVTGGEEEYGRNSIKDAKKHEIFKTLLENEEFKNQFINKLSDYLNTIFIPEVVNKKIDSISLGLKPEMAEHINRWRYPAEDMNGWYSQISKLRKFAQNRPEKVREHLAKEFDLGEMHNIVASVDDYNNGSIKLNSLSIDANNRNYTGMYFKDIPISIKAIPKEGYIFSKWEGIKGEDIYDSNMELNLTEDTNLKATFVEVKDIELGNLPEQDRIVNFNYEVSSDFLNTNNFYISTDKEGNDKLKNMDISYNQGKLNSIRLTLPKGSLKSGSDYYLFVRPEIESTDGDTLNVFTRAKFNID